MGKQGIVGVGCGTTAMLGTVDDVYSYYEHPEQWRERSRAMLAAVERRMERIARMEPRPDIIFCGGSGSLVFQTPAMFRELALPVLKRVTEMAADIGIPTHVHSCGPETELVKMAAEETKLSVIDPLEARPMGDCDLADLKRRFGKRIILKGNLHTTDVMLRGSVDDVARASRKAIDDAAAGGGFVLSTGDQCGRDTPDGNIRAMVEVARTYGRY
jgi:uroporphyrinogen decarboxylase